MTIFSQAPSLTYSTSAVDTLPLFHRVRHVIFVEGGDDVTFWKYILEAFNFEAFLVKPAGGSTEINKYTQAILDEDRNIVVCRDQDYLAFDNTLVDHPRIIYTYGYSIENSLYCAESIAGLIADYTRSADTNIEDVANWQSSISSEFNELLIHDVAKYLYRRSIKKILGDNCSIYLENTKAIRASQDKMKSFLEDITKQFSDEELAETRRRVSEDNRVQWYQLRGHFLTHAVINYIKYRIYQVSGKAETMSKENLFVELVRRFIHDCRQADDAEFIRSQIYRLANEQHQISGDSS